MYYILALVSGLVYLFLSFGAAFAPAVMKAYDALPGRYADLMFFLAVLLGLCSLSCLLVLHSRKKMPKYIWANWKENALFVFQYCGTVVLATAYLWFGYQTGFFSHLEYGWVYATFTVIILALFVIQMIYWWLMFAYNRKITK